MSRLPTFPILLLAALSGLVSDAARGETGGLRGIGADVRAAQLRDAQQDATTAAEAAGARERQLRELDAERARAKQALRTRVRALYRITRPGRAPIAGGFDAVRRHVARVKRMTLLVQSDVASLRTLAAQEQGLRAPLSPAPQSAPTLATDRLPVQLPIPASGSGRETSVSAARGGRAGPAGAFYGIRLSDPPETSGFATLQGRLAVPISGEMRVVDARRGENDGAGLELQTRAGTAVRAAAAGRVAFADRYGSYGRLVILDHGDSYYTSYGGLGDMDVRVGDDLSAFARIGTVGGEANTPALYFEVRKGARTLSPRTWLGL
jgi:murein DD-endopeptidase MepM/ murein hydrolase activator NlpD